ncbi:hypothetical protein VPMG_00080 [Vibrio phage VBP32]|uniref:Coil containing protein n=2 Tax=Stoningtonvirus VBP47 TaxID=2846606 RepID=M4SM31_9CAUD|nr:virion structural protein [Vibrio phage VBP47]YP_007676570.1 virion structural protein [Vibrio phage VBP32]AGH57073.1 hypothetical protein VPNG_00049 [Vibrio phage VBP47]AGH57219.1 hypothetical protein VPMG_00080 [Vibrio phage VBP32]
MAEEVNFDEITDGCPQGDGIFDKLMRSIKAHLDIEYDSQRIRGSEYTQVYLNALQTAIGQSLQWQLGAQIAENQALLIEKQIENAEKQNLLLEEQRALLIAQTAQVVQQTENLDLESLNIPKQGDLLDSQNAQVAASTAYVAQQTLTEEKNTDIAGYNLTDTLPAQKAILDQKFVTEEAQTKDITSQGTVTGAVGKRNDLLVKQTDGFTRDAEQKAARAVFDTWGMAIGSGIDGTEFPAEVQTDKLDEIIRQLREGADIAGDVLP